MFRRVDVWARRCENPLIDRRTFLTGTGAVLLATPLAAEAQQASGLRRIGYLGISSPSLEPNYVEASRHQLRDLGYIEGQGRLDAG